MNNIITQSIIHPNEEGVQVSIISSAKDGYQSEIRKIFDKDNILELCKNEGEKERIKNFPIKISEIGALRIISLGKEGTDGDELIERIKIRLNIISARTLFQPILIKILLNCICIGILEYNISGSDEYTEIIKGIFSDYIKSTPK